MKRVTEIAPGIHYVGANDRTKHRFEGLWPLPHGVSYNAYIIDDEKIALVDTIDSAFTGRLLGEVREVIGGRPVDYLIINHMEPDHSASIHAVRKTWPDVTIVGNAKTLQMVEGFYGISSTNTLTVGDGDTLSLGARTLQFHLIPMVHWPETMVTYEKTEQILFSGDAFGTFGTLDGAVVDEDMNVDKYWDEMVRYYANIVGKYGNPVQKALQKLSPLTIKMICSTHGPVWKKHIPQVIDIYDKLSRYENLDEGVVLVYGSMYGNTELMAETVAQGLAEGGVKNIVIHNVSKSHPSVILRDIFKYKGLIIGSPTYCNELYPEIDSLIRKIELRDVKNRIFGYFGSFTWAGAAVKRLNAFAENMKWDTVDIVVEEKQGLKPDNYALCLELGRKTAQKMK